MGIRSALVSRARDDGRSVRALLVRDVVDCQGILVVSIADVTAVVLLVWAFVQNTLGVMDVSVQFGTARTVWVSDVVDIDVNQSSSAGAGTRLSSDGDGISELLVLLHISEHSKRNEKEQRLYSDSPLQHCETDQQGGR
jgi:hypothetical protein